MSQTHYVLEKSKVTLCGLTNDHDRIVTSAEGVAGGTNAVRADHCAACREELPKIFRQDYSPRTLFTNNGPDSELERFLVFYDANKGGPPMELEGGVLSTKGCSPGTRCCSTHFDLGGLVDELRELVE